MKKYRKKPLIVEAIQWDGYINQTQMNCLYDWGLQTYNVAHQWEDGSNRVDIYIHTLEGMMECDVGDFIVKGIEGEFYPVKESVFLKSYEAAE